MKINFTPKAFLLLILFSACSFGQTTKMMERKVFGQTLQSVNPKNGLIRCVSSEYEQSLRQKNPNRATTEAFENWLAPKVAEAKQRLSTSRSTNEVINIPVVVHVIHNGDAVGTNENISDARVLSQITVLNEDYRKMLDTPGYNDNPIGADMEINFVMAQVKPDGTATNGIDRVNLGTANWSTESSVEGTLKPQTSWDPTQYFNIWVAQFSTSSSAELGGILGYAQFPSNSGLGGLDTDGGEAATDGVIIDWRCFGSSDYATGNYFDGYDKGRTASHEIGHCFGLIHIWGDNSSCTVNTTDSHKDYCPDTPAANQENYDCDAVYNSCTAAAGNDMTENYMDYTNDVCMNTFTLDQKGRVLAVLLNADRRETLTSSTVGQPLGTASFDLFKSVNLYPNPAQDLVAVHIPDSIGLPESYTLYNNLGQVLATKKISATADLTINTSAYSQGIYFIKIVKGTAVKTLRFVKN